MAEVLLQRWESFLPENLRACSPAQLANYLSELINAMLSVNGMIDKMLDSGADFGDFLSFSENSGTLARM